MKHTRAPLLGLPLSSVALLLAACGSGDSTGGGGEDSTSSTNSTASGGAGGAGGAFGVDECADGTAVCDPNADCVDTPGYYQCVCKAGYDGDGETCADVDECQSLLADCDPNALCTNTAGSYTCACPPGFTGDGSACDATFTTLAAGQYHACAVRSDKTLWCWGHNTSGQVGTGTTDPLYLRPAQAGSGSDWAEVTAGGSFTCARDSARQISCFGTNGGGQLGDGTTTARTTPTPIGGGFTDWIQVESGANHTCAIREGGSLHCWGTNLRGQIGDGTTNNALTPTLVSAGPWLSVSAGSEFTCAVKADHTLFCWGLDSSRQLGDGKTTSSSVPVQEKTLATDWASVTAANAYACGVKLDGTRFCWGANYVGQGGDGTTAAITEPKAADPSTDWKRLDGGDLAACGIKQSGALHCWGDGSLGQTGQPGNETSLPTPTQVGTDTDWTAVAGGLRFACGLRADGRIRCWGSAARAALGLGWSSDRNEPTPVGAAADWAEISVQLDDGCAIRQGGDLYCWGRNLNGQLGDGSAVTRIDPAPVGAGLTWKRVAVGRTHTCGIAAMGAGPDTLHCWGADSNGEQGNGAGGAQPAPAPITAPPTVTGWIDLAAGLNHTCAVAEGGSLWCWGRNANGQLGDGTTTSQPAPKQVLPAGAADFVRVVASGDFTCALRAAGALLCWGRNDVGQTGNGTTTTPVTTPVAVGNYLTVSAGANHACAVAPDHTLHCWGRNANGELGLGNSVSPVLTPTKVGADADWAAAALGQGLSTCAVKQSGELWCWGVGSFGQLGLGGLASFTTPKKVPSPAPWKALSLGNEHACGIGADGRLWCWGASYGAQLGGGVPFVSAPTPIVDPL